MFKPGDRVLPVWETVPQHVKPLTLMWRVESDDRGELWFARDDQARCFEAWINPGTQLIK